MRKTRRMQWLTLLGCHFRATPAMGRRWICAGPRPGNRKHYSLHHAPSFCPGCDNNTHRGYRK